MTARLGLAVFASAATVVQLLLSWWWTRRVEAGRPVGVVHRLGTLGLALAALIVDAVLGWWPMVVLLSVLVLVSAAEIVTYRAPVDRSAPTSRGEVR